MQNTKTNVHCDAYVSRSFFKANYIRNIEIKYMFGSYLSRFWLKNSSASLLDIQEVGPKFEFARLTSDVER